MNISLVRSFKMRSNILRIYSVGLIIVLISLFAATQDCYGQIVERKINVHLKNATLEQVIVTLEKSSGVKFIFREELLKGEYNISFDADTISLKSVLTSILTPLNISYNVHDNESRITLKKDKRRGLNEASEQEGKFNISGTVNDQRSGQGLAGVNIIIKGTSLGTTTDAEGHYNLPVSEGDDLVFSFIGFLPSEVSVKDQTTINIDLVEDLKNLEEVTVHAGYWDVNAKEQTGNISSVSAKQIASQSVTNPLQALQGRMPGVQIQQITGIPGDGFTVQIRGINSIRGQSANEPLYIIDGVPFSSTTYFSSGGGVVRAGTSPLNSINPMDIESVEVLKDADATAVYGSRGSNGVVLITTKRGQAGKTKVDLNMYTGIGLMSRQMDMLNTSQYLAMRREAFKNDNIIPTAANAPDLLLWDTTRYTDWRKELLGGTARISNIQANISGGNNTTQFLVGAGFLKQSTVFPGDFNYQKGSTHVNLNHRSLNSKFAMSFSTSFVIDNNLLPTTDLTTTSFALAPNTPVIYNADGSLNFQNGTFVNPYGDLKRRYETSTRNLISNANLSYEILKGLRIKTNVGLNVLDNKEKNLIPIAAQNPANSPTGTATIIKGSITTWILEPQLDFQKEFGGGRFNALVGTTFQQTIKDRQGYVASGYINDTQLENPLAAASLNASGVDYSEYKYNAVFGRLNYNWRERYILNLTGRRDGSSRFGVNRRFANFGAIGTAWVFSNENIIKNSMPFLSFGKLRASYGVTGSDQIGDYQYLDTHSSTQYNYQGGKGLIPTRLVNPDYGWEENRKFEVGIDLGFFTDRLNLSVSYYNNRSSNQLIGYTLPAITGFTSVQSNLPAEIQNTGVEIMVTTVNVRKKNLSWNSSINLTFPRNLLVSYPNIDASSYVNTYAVGRSLYVAKKYQSNGVDSQTGLYSFEDFDHDGTLNSLVDAQFNKERIVNFFGGVQNTIIFGNFEVQFFIQFVNQIGNTYQYTMSSPPGARANQPTAVLARWQKPGDITDVQRFTTTGVGSTAFGNFSASSDGVIADASFVRLQNASVSYTMPVSLSKKVSSEKIRFYLQGQNLLTITDYLGSDPETQNTRTLSPLRMISVGAQLTF